MSTPGGKQFDRPDFGDAVPPTPPRQGSMGPEGMGSNRVDEHTFESGSIPGNTGAIESNWGANITDDGLTGTSLRMTEGISDTWNGGGLRGFRTTPIGGSYNPGQGSKPSNPGTERSMAGYN